MQVRAVSTRAIKYAPLNTHARPRRNACQRAYTPSGWRWSTEHSRQSTFPGARSGRRASRGNWQQSEDASRRKGAREELHRGTQAHKNDEKATDTRCRQETGQNLHEEGAPIRVWILKDCHDLCNIRLLLAFEDEWLPLCQSVLVIQCFPGSRDLHDVGVPQPTKESSFAHACDHGGFTIQHVLLDGKCFFVLCLTEHRAIYAVPAVCH